MSKYIAEQEGYPVVPASASDSDDPRQELRDLAHSLRVTDVLDGWRTAVRTLSAHSSGAKIFVIALDLTDQVAADKAILNISGFKDARQAFNVLARMEQERATRSEAEQPVMVSVNSIAALRSAFPGYHLDAEAFIKTVRKAVEG
jgi:predicted kinase